MLKADIEKVMEKPKKNVEIPRLSRLFGDPFYVTVQAIDSEVLAEITEDHTEYSKNGKRRRQNNYAIGKEIVVNGLIEPDLRNAELMKHYGAVTPNDLVDKLFLAGEVGKIAETVNELCGLEKTQTEIDEYVKN